MKEENVVPCCSVIMRSLLIPEHINEKEMKNDWFILCYVVWCGVSLSFRLCSRPTWF